MSEKPNCYLCEHRRGLPWSYHSQCTHPEVLPMLEDALGELISMFGRDAGPLGPVRTSLNVTGSPHGIAHGWFNWPFNFDPVWLERCDGFSPSNGKADKTEAE